MHGALSQPAPPAGPAGRPRHGFALPLSRYLPSSFWRAFGTAGGPSNVDTFEETDADSAFDSGKAAFLRGWDSSYANALSAASKISDPADVGVETLPTFQGEPGPGWSALGGWGLFVNPHTQNLLASGGGDGTIRLWDSRTGTRRGVLSGSARRVDALAFSPGGTQLASGGDDDAVRLWDVATLTPVGVLTGPANTVAGVAFGPGGHTLAGVGAGRHRRVLGHEARRYCRPHLRLAPGGQRLRSQTVPRRQHRVPRDLPVRLTGHGTPRSFG